MEEESTSWVRSIRTKDRDILVFRLTPLEARCAMARRLKAYATSGMERRRALDELNRLRAEWTELLFGESLVQKAQEIADAYALRAMDSLQLASALEATENTRTRGEFVTLDRELAEAAGRAGFRVLTRP